MPKVGIAYLLGMREPTLDDVVTDILNQVQGAVDRIVIKTNVGVMVLPGGAPTPVAAGGAPSAPSKPSLPARLLQPQVEVYVQGTAAPVATYTPYGVPTPNPELGGLLLFGTLALASAGVFYLVRGIVR